MSEETKDFIAITKDKPPHKRTVGGFQLLSDNRPAVGLSALDFGCGAGRDTRYLLAQDLDVTAVDSNPEALASLSDLDENSALHKIQSSFDQFEFGRYDFISSQWSLSFNPPETFVAMFTRLKAALKPGGVLTCNIFGPNDEWNRPDSRKTFLSRDQIETLLEGLVVVELKEVVEDGVIANGTPKHWHYFDILAKKDD